MKIALGQKIHLGPWGGGNNFIISLVEHLQRNGHTVVNELKDDDIDIILLTDPRRRNPTTSFIANDIFNYLIFKNKKAIVVHRINECDERKNTKFMNLRLRCANCVADHTIFIGSWLKSLNVWHHDEPVDEKRYSLVLNGADARVFNADGNIPWNKQDPFRLVTHHWGGNLMKGFDIYKYLDEMLLSPLWKGRLEFTYIGNLPPGFKFKNARHLPPDSGQTLAAELKSHHAYITASKNEPAGMHHIEGALCGLPILYRNSGALPEYCAGFGVEFSSPDDFEDALTALMNQYSSLKLKMPNYPNTADLMVSGYMRVFEKLIMNQDEIVQIRRLWKTPFSHIFNQFSN